mgnify:CR=1 FL=1
MRAFLIGLMATASMMMSAATRADDVAGNRLTIANHYFDVIGLRLGPTSLALGYTYALDDHLDPHAVTLLDKRRMAEMLPQGLIDDLSALYRNTVFHSCFAKLSDKQAALLADFIRNRTDTSEMYSNHLFERDLRYCVRVIGSRWGTAEMHPHMLSITQYNSDIAEILDMPGIARFPNRITRRTVLHSFQ